MKIAYLIPENISNHPGLNYKISRQADVWVQEGYNVYLVRLAEGVVTDHLGEVLYTEDRSSSFLPLKFGVLHNNYNSYKFAVLALKFVMPDFTYSRYLFPSFNVGEIKKFSGKLIVEINADDVTEYDQKNLATGLFNRLLRYRFLRDVDGFVFVTNEILKSTSFTSFVKNSIVIANGVDTNDFYFVEATDNKEPNLVFIGSPNQSWHGIDKIEQLAKMLPYTLIHIIGPSKTECNKQWSTSPDNVVFHGYLESDEANNIIRNSDIGIGTLSLYRAGMNEACPLKVRQYLAFGIPVIAAYQDTDLVDKKDFYLELPNNDVELIKYKEEIEFFIDNAFGNRNLRLNARSFATNILSNKNKELKRLSFFEEVLNGK